MDDALVMRLFTGFWSLFGLTPVVFKFGWKDIKEDVEFTQNFNRIIFEVDRLAKIGKVSLIGCSAGGSIVINIFSQRRDIIHRVINICGALRFSGTASKFDTPAYLKSLRYCEQAITKLSEKDKKKIMTIRPRFGDEFVKSEKVIIEGAKNISLPTFEHIFSIMMALTIFSKSVFIFLKEKFIQI
jgi:pimeloyl-ACP methyl ester carboxylesterase